MSTLRSKLTNSVTTSRKISIWKNIVFCFIAQFFGWRFTASLSSIFLPVCILLFALICIFCHFGSSNWDCSEIALLRQLVQENMSTLRSKLTNSVTTSRKISIWKNIAVQINSLGLHYRTDKEVKAKWQNISRK
jgi:sensor domain CHASE-containing protein